MLFPRACLEHNRASQEEVKAQVASHDVYCQNCRHVVTLRSLHDIQICENCGDPVTADNSSPVNDDSVTISEAMEELEEKLKKGGRCTICKAPMLNHPYCEGCGVLVGRGHLEYNTTEFRGHKICAWCIDNWQKKESRFKRDISWEEYVKPKNVGMYLGTYIGHR
jgi:ribosomal protein L37AE/L43A